ncbi:hypothetical protein L1987_63760 [Smallanthus sonchifolius]|uniref:Uncharacterized protein n=1 Tax=Smallanthus sonchifolius TaxID=185202 RepID=A0ACB9CE49_9ASTR|nr:hypothetical protein L1987_63760 [Smallanthus sonchifolius]
MMILIVSDGCSGGFVVVNSRDNNLDFEEAGLPVQNMLSPRTISVVREWRPAQNTHREEDNPYEASRSKSTSFIAVKDKSTDVHKATEACFGDFLQ